MAFDFKKEYQDLYRPTTQPSIIEIPKMNFISVCGKGNPNDDAGAYKAGLELLYAVAYTLKMSYKSEYKIKGFFEYVVPPLEGFWWQEGIQGMDYEKMDELKFISLIRLPDFITKNDFDWAIDVATNKKKKDFSKVEFYTYDEGLCVQCMHIGSYRKEPITVEQMHAFMIKKGYELDINNERFHHEKYLSDPRKTEASKLKTVIRHPIKKVA